MYHAVTYINIAVAHAVQAKIIANIGSDLFCDDKSRKESGACIGIFKGKRLEIVARAVKVKGFGGRPGGDGAMQAIGNIRATAQVNREHWPRMDVVK